MTQRKGWTAELIDPDGNIVKRVYIGAKNIRRPITAESIIRALLRELLK